MPRLSSHSSSSDEAPFQSLNGYPMVVAGLLVHGLEPLFVLRPSTVAGRAPNGDSHVVDGYGRDYIHRFNKTGKYRNRFGGRGAPWSIEHGHKIAIDPRFEPTRLLCTDRPHDRLIHMDLQLKVLERFRKDPAGPVLWLSVRTN